MPENQAVLFKFDFSAGFFELLLEAFGICLGNAFLDNAGSAVDHLLGFFQAKTGQFFDELDNGCLLYTSDAADD